MKPNIGWLFYKDYYRFPNNVHKWVSGLVSTDNKTKKAVRKEIFNNVFKEKNEKIYALKLKDYTAESKIDAFAVPNSFVLTTMYPGLLLGTGYMHESGTEGEFKLGFFFDHTSGLPVIPGSSVKGALRSVFPTLDENEMSRKTHPMARMRYIKEKLIELKVENAEKLDILCISALENEIFEGTNAQGNNLSIYKRDIFHDAVPVGTQNVDGKFLADDYITPHGDNPLKNPTPLQFLKVLPQVSFQFRFDLKDTVINNIYIKAETKQELFRLILEDMGIGAKTNVGYGKFEKKHKA